MRSSPKKSYPQRLESNCSREIAIFLLRTKKDKYYFRNDAEKTLNFDKDFELAKIHGDGEIEKHKRFETKEDIMLKEQLKAEREKKSGCFRNRRENKGRL